MTIKDNVFDICPSQFLPWVKLIISVMKERWLTLRAKLKYLTKIEVVVMWLDMIKIEANNIMIESLQLTPQHVCTNQS